MKKDSDFTIGDLPLVNPVQERIRLLYDNDFLDHEIATLSGLKIKTIKKITKGKYLPYGKERDRFCSIFDELIARLNITQATVYDGPCPEADIDATDYVAHKLEESSVIVYRGTADNNMMIEADNVKYKLALTNVTLYKGTDNKKIILQIRGNVVFSMF